MASVITESDFKRLSTIIERECGLHIEMDKAYLIETRLTQLMAQCGCETYGEFCGYLERGLDAKVRDKLVDAMTTNETLWFRDGHPYAILRELMLPAFAADLRSGKRSKVRLWSAAASTGQEAYSISMTIHEFCGSTYGISPSQFEIVATDISPAALTIAQMGRYDGLAMSRGMTDSCRSQFFRQDGRVWVLDDKIKKLVTFKRFNLQDDPVSLGRFDAIFIRYVMIYFAAELKQRIFTNLARILTDPGYLIIGATESPRGFSSHFNACTHGSGTYYLKATP